MTALGNLNFIKTHFLNPLEGNAWRFFCPLLLVSGVLLIFNPLFLNSGPHLIMDQPMWTAFTQVMSREIIPEQKWFWGIITDRENAGLVMGQSYSLNIILLWLLHFLFPVDLCVKIFLFLSVVVFTLAFYLVGRKFMHPFWAMLASFFILGEIFLNAVNGMWYSYLAIGLALLFWITSLRFLEQPAPKFWILSVLLLALTLYAHPMGFIAGMVIWIFLLGTILLDRGNPHRLKLTGFYFSIPWIALLLASPQVGAMLSPQFEKLGEPSFYQDIRNLPSLSWEAWLKKIMKIQYSEIRHLDALLFFGLLGLLVLFKKEPKLKGPAYGIYCMGVFLTSEMILLLPDPPNLLLKLIHFSYRFGVYLQMILILAAGIGLDFLYEASKKMRFQTVSLEKGLKVFRFLLLLVVFGLGVVSVRSIYIHRHESLMTLETFEKKGELRSLWKWLSQNVNPRETRVYFEDTLGTYPWAVKNNYNHPLALTSVHTGINQVGGWCGFVSDFAYRYNHGIGGDLFGKHSPRDLTKPLVAENLKLLNCRYIIANSPKVTGFLDSISFLRRVETIGTFAIFEYSALSPAWAYKNDGQEKVDLHKISPRRYALAATGQAGEWIQISLAYNPNWQARQNDTLIPIQYHKALMQIALPKSGPQVISLEYRIEKKKPLFFAMGGIILLVMVSLLISCTGPPKE